MRSSVRVIQSFRIGRKCPKIKGFGAEWFVLRRIFMVAEQPRPFRFI